MNIKIKGICRYPHLNNASAPKGSDKKKYGMQVLLHKSSPEYVNIKKQYDETIANSHPTGKPAKWNDCLKDLAIEEPASTVLKDYMALKVGTLEEYGRPPVVDVNNQPIVDTDLDTNVVGKEVYIVGKFVTYSNIQTGINFYPSATMVTDRMGNIPVESLSSVPDAATMFANSIDLTGGQPVMPSAPAPSMPTPPPVPGTPPAPPAPLAPPTPQYQMTAKAAGATRDQFIAQGWTDEQLIQNGYMLPPNGVTPSFIQ